MNLEGLYIKISGVITAFLRNGDKYLLMKRADDRRCYPGVWCGIGGGLEPSESENPVLGCLREIYEETGIEEHKINNLKLRYIHIGMSDFGAHIVVHYIFFGETSETNLADTYEGESFWVHEDEVAGKEYTPVMRRFIEHYFSAAIGSDTVFLYNGTDGSISPLSH